MIQRQHIPTLYIIQKKCLVPHPPPPNIESKQGFGYGTHLQIEFGTHSLLHHRMKTRDFLLGILIRHRDARQLLQQFASFLRCAAYARMNKMSTAERLEINRQNY